MNVRHAPAQSLDRRRRLVGQRQVRDVQVGLHGGVIDSGEKTGHAGHVVKERELEGLKLQRDLQSQAGGCAFTADQRPLLVTYVQQVAKMSMESKPISRV